MNDPMPKKKVQAKAKAIKKPVEVSSHDWLPAKYKFDDNAVTACWCERRVSESGLGLRIIIIKCNCEANDLDEDWKQLISESQRAGYYLEVHGKSVMTRYRQIEPEKGKERPVLPFEVKLV